MLIKICHARLGLLHASASTSSGDISTVPDGDRGCYTLLDDRLAFLAQMALSWMNLVLPSPFQVT